MKRAVGEWARAAMERARCIVAGVPGGSAPWSTGAERPRASAETLNAKTRFPIYRVGIICCIILVVLLCQTGTISADPMPPSAAQMMAPVAQTVGPVAQAVYPSWPHDSIEVQ